MNKHEFKYVLKNERLSSSLGDSVPVKLMRDPKEPCNVLIEIGGTIASVDSNDLRHALNWIDHIEKQFEMKEE